MATTMPVRVTVLDAWDEVALEVTPGTTVADVKQAALAHCRVRGRPRDYVVKHLGVELLEEGRTLTDAGVPANGALIVLPRRRRPIR